VKPPVASLVPTPDLHGAPLNGAASFSSPHRKTVGVALVLSIAVHVLAYLATPGVIRAFIEPREARFDAVLVPLAPSPATVPRTATAPRPKVSPRITPPRVKSAAEFAAPDNAIAVAAAVPMPPIEPLADLAMPSPGNVELLPVPPMRPPPPDFPGKLAIAYALTSSIVDGTANLTWERDGNRYEAATSIRANGIFAEMFVGTIRQLSRGEITAYGLRPERFSLARGSGEPETAEFLRASNELRMNSRGDTRTVPLERELQDMQSFLFQMGFDANRLASDEARLDVMVTNARKVYRYRFRRAGEEMLATPAGEIATIHLIADAANPEDVYEVWLAPQYFHLPVKLKFYMGRYPVEQTVSSISASPN
jgi:hypothetical protein